MSDTPPRPVAAVHPPRWQPLPALERRIAGVLVEKAKTTPDAYPMSINALVAGCNQKSNRYPLMNVEPEDVEAALDRLRELGAAAVIQGGGRVARYRHYLYEWLGVEKVEMAVMTELLLRGAQTEGELRGRAARMEPIADLAALRPVLQSLKAKKLLVSLTSEGRGHVVSHALYLPQEMEKLRTQFAGQSPPDASSEWDTDESPQTASASSAAPSVGFEAFATVPARTDTRASTSPPVANISAEELRQLRSEIELLRSEVTELTSKLSDCRHDIDQLKSQLGV